MRKYERPELITISSKGQIVIPQSIREKLGLRPKSQLLVYGYQDAVIMKKMEVPDVVKDLKELYKRINARLAKYGRLSEEEVEELVQKYRKARATSNR